MSDERSQEQYEAGEILYQGNQVPTLLRLVYAVFTIWAVSYFVLYCLPNILAWFK